MLRITSKMLSFSDCPPLLLYQFQNRWGGIGCEAGATVEVLKLCVLSLLQSPGKCLLQSASCPPADPSLCHILSLACGLDSPLLTSIVTCHG